MIRASITFKVGKLYIHFGITSTLFMEKKRGLKCIQTEFNLINQGLIKKNIENLPIDNLIIQKDTLIVQIPMDDNYYFSDTFIESKSLNFKFNDCSINIMFDQQPHSFQELSQKPVEYNIEVIRNR